MRILTPTYNLTYQVPFVAPCIEIARRQIDILDEFHRNLGVRYVLPSTHMKSVGGTALSDLLIKFELYNGAVGIAVTTDNLSLTFTGLRSADEDIAKDIIALSEVSLSKVVPQLRRDETVVDLNYTLNIAEGEEAPTDYVNSFTRDCWQPDLSDFGECTIDQGLSQEILNPEQGWRCVFRLIATRSNKSQILMSIQMHYSNQSVHRSIDERAVHLNELVGSLVDQLEIVES